MGSAFTAKAIREWIFRLQKSHSPESRDFKSSCFAVIYLYSPLKSLRAGLETTLYTPGLYIRNRQKKPEAREEKAEMEI